MGLDFSKAASREVVTVEPEAVQDMPVDSDTIYTSFEDKETKVDNVVTNTTLYKGDRLSGLQNTIRVGFVLYNSEAEATDNAESEETSAENTENEDNRIENTVRHLSLSQS
mgnify:CR=1 FL=1